MLSDHDEANPEAHMQDRSIGGRQVSAIGLGGMPLSVEGRPDEARAIATVHAALDAGVTFIDTADAYHATATDVGHNELLIAKALRLAGSAPTTSWWRPRVGIAVPATGPGTSRATPPT